MANIFDYLDWRGDIPFSVDPFCAVDALILSELSYTKFENIPDDSSQISIIDAEKEFFKVHTIEEILASTSLTARAPLLMKKMNAGARFKNTKICNYVNEIDYSNDSQFSASTFILDDDTAFISFRGTDGTVVGWKEDFNLSYLDETAGQRSAVEYLNKIGRDFCLKIRVGGHSKGGNFAVYAASFCNPDIQNELINVFSFDAPGFKSKVIVSDGYKNILPKIQRIVPDTSIIGTLLSHDSEKMVVKSTASGLLQHDGFSWEVLGNSFVNAEISDISIFIEKTLSNWLENTTDDERKLITDTVFGLFESTGNDTFHKMSEQKWRTTESIFESIKTIPKEQRQEVSHMVLSLLQTGGKVATENIPKKTISKK